jgi:hypothetical protein
MAGKKKVKEENVIVDMRNPRLIEKEPLKVITEDIEDLDEDVIQVREYTNDKYLIVTRDPHGFSYIEGPGLPANLKNAYTSYMLAKQALDVWLKGK